MSGIPEQEQEKEREIQQEQEQEIGLEDNSSIEDVIRYISPIAAATLEFVTPCDLTKLNGEIAYITSKQALIWAAVTRYLAQMLDPVRTSDINRAVHKAVYARQDASSFSWRGYERGPVIPTDNPTENVPEMAVSDHTKAMRIAEAVLRDLTGGGISPTIQDWDRLMNLGYEWCFDNDLITDPVISTGLAIAGGFAILGFVPMNISKRTKKGEIVYRKLQAALWKYERKRVKGGDVETNVVLNATRIARALKVALVHGFHELSIEPGNEGDPGEPEPEIPL